MKLNPSLKDFWRTKARYKVLYGGRASSKSEDTAGILVYLATHYTLKILCTRLFQNKISDSVYSLIVKKIEQAEYAHLYTITKNSIKCNKTGSEFLFYGLWRHTEEIKSIDGIDICFMEEAHNITEDMWNILVPTIRKENSFFIVVFNPQLLTDFIYQRLVINPPKNSLSHKINYLDNPYLSNTMLEVIADAKKEDLESYNHIYLGNPKVDDDEAIIKRAWIMSCIDAHIVLDKDITGGKRLGYDVADSGSDLNACILMNGGLVESLISWKAKEDELYESSQRVYNLAVKNDAKVNYDSNGVGAGVGSNMKQMNELSQNNVQYFGFDSAETPAYADQKYKIESRETQQTNREYFENRKAQAWWLLADRIKATHRAVTLGEDIDLDVIISISSDLVDLEKLITELSTPRKKQSGRLKNMVEKKIDLQKRGIKSPNLADSFVMCAYPYMENKMKLQTFNIKGL